LKKPTFRPALVFAVALALTMRVFARIPADEPPAAVPAAG